MLNSAVPPSSSSPLLRKRYNEQLEKQQKAQEKLLRFGVDTPTPNELGQLMEQVNRWGVDIFKLGTLAANHPLTAVTYTVLKVRLCCFCRYRPTRSDSFDFRIAN